MAANRPAFAERLRDLAHRVARLRPDFNRQDRYFENRDELAHEIRRLAEEYER